LGAASRLCTAPRPGASSRSTQPAPASCRSPRVRVAALHYKPNGNEGSVGCQVRAYGRTDGGGDPPTADAVSPLVKITPPLYIAGRGMKPQKLSTIERSGFAAQGECNRACSLKLELVLAAPDARRLGIGQGATTIGSGRGTLRAGKSTVRARVRHLAKLNHAGFVRLTLRLSAVGKDGTRAPAIVLTKLKIRFHQ
jgi:hypothetical protein